jgi:hypothetical protein
VIVLSHIIATVEIQPILVRRVKLLPGCGVKITGPVSILRQV